MPVSPTITPAKFVGQGLTAADQFNILLFHTSYAEKEWNSIVSSDTEATKTVHVTSPIITAGNVEINFPSRFEIGKLYRVKGDRVTFFTTDPCQKLWPEEWYAKDFFAMENDLLLFLGVIRYDILNTVTGKRNAICVLSFLANETMVQYPMFHHTDFIVASPDFSFHVESLQKAMQTVLQDSCELFLHK